MQSRLPIGWPLAVAVLAWGFNFVALKALYAEIGPPALALSRYAVMWALFVALCLATRESLRYERRGAFAVLWFGFLSMGVYMVLFMEGMRNSYPAEGAILLNTSPVLTLLLAAAIKLERFRLLSLVGGIVAFLGVALVIAPGISGGADKAAGNMLVLASAAVWAYCVVLMKPLLSEYTPLRLVTLSMPGGLVPLFVYWIAVDRGDMPLLQLSPLAWLMFAHVALASGVLAFLAFYRGVRDVGASGASLAMYFVPPLTVLFEWLVFGRTLLPVQFVGLAVVLAGVFLAQRSRGHTDTTAPLEPA